MIEADHLQPRFIQANGLEFAYLEASPEADAGAPLVLCLHGFPDTAWSFSNLLGELVTAGYRAVAVFMRGYAPSELAADRDYSTMALGRDVIALIEHFGVDKAAVVGHDWGAAAAYAAAGMRPDRISCLVAAGVPHLRRFLLRPSRAQLRASHYMFKFQVRGHAERMVSRDDFAWLEDLVRSWSPGWEVPDDYWRHVKDALRERVRLRAALAYYRALPGSLFRREVWRTVLRPLRVPARVVCGENDHCILPASFEDQAHLFADGYTLVRMEGAGHFMHLEAPAEFARQVLDALESVRTKASRE